MQFKSGESLDDVARSFEKYLNTDNKGAPFKVELSAAPVQAPAPTKPALSPQQDQIKRWKAELSRLEAIRFKTAGHEMSIDRLKRQIAADPSKWQEGQGVAWRVTRDQTNRGFRVVEVRPDTGEAVIRQVSDTGLTSTGGDYDRVQDQLVDIIDLTRDRKYDQAPSVMPAEAPGRPAPAVARPAPSAVPAKQPWEQTKTEYVDFHVRSPAMHRYGVEQALKADKPVPPEVLADYPDLAAKYGRAAEAAPPTAPPPQNIADAAAPAPPSRMAEGRAATMGTPPFASLLQEIDAINADPAAWVTHEGQRQLTPAAQNRIVEQLMLGYRDGVINRSELISLIDESGFDMRRIGGGTSEDVLGYFEGRMKPHPTTMPTEKPLTAAEIDTELAVLGKTRPPNANAFIDEITAAPDEATLKAIARRVQHESAVTHTLTGSDDIAIDRAMTARRDVLIDEAQARTAAIPRPEAPTEAAKPILTSAQEKVLTPARKAVLSGKGSLKVWRDDAGNVYVERAIGGSGYSYSTVKPDGTVKSGMPEQQKTWTIVEDSKAGAAEAVKPSAAEVRPAEAAPPAPPRPPATEAPPPAEVPPSKPGFAGNIRLSKYPPELRDDIKAVYDKDPAKFEAARRGVRPDEEVRADAQALIDSVGGKGEKSVRRWKAGQAWNAEEVLALREVLASRTRVVLDAQKTLREGGDSTANLVRLRLAIEEQQLTQQAVAGVTAEAGRALRQFRQNVEGVIASGDTKRLETILNRLGGRQNAEELSAALAKVDLGNQEAVYKFIRNATKPKAADYLTEIFYNSILSGIRTHEVNTIGNTLAAILAPIETIASAAVEVPLAAIARRPRERFFREVKPEVFAMARALPEGVRKALYILKNGYSWDDVAKLEIRRPQAFKGKPGAAINMPSRALAAEDAIFRSVHYAGALNAGAYRIARREGLRGQALAGRIAELLTDPTPSLLGYAGKMEDYRVYQQQPGQFARGLVQIRDTDVGGIQPLRFALPFIQTPANLVKYGLERSPLGVLNPTLWRNVARRNPEAADQLGRWLIGSTIAAAVAYYAADGKITGAAPEGQAQRDLFYRQGKQPYSIRVGDRWLPYNRFEPFNQPLAQVATTVEAMREGKDVRESVGSIVAGIGKNFISQTYMSGVSDLMNAIDDPERYGVNIFERSGVGLAVPFSAASRTIAQTIDPTIRQSKGIAEELQASVPGLSQNLMPRLNVFGAETRRESPAYLPVEARLARNDPVDNELARLNVNIGFAGNSIRNVALSRDEQQAYQRLRGTKLKEMLDRVVASPIYQNLDDTSKAAVLERAGQRVANAAGLEYLKQLGPDEIRRRLLTRAVGR